MYYTLSRIIFLNCRWRKVVKSLKKKKKCIWWTAPGYVGQSQPIRGYSLRPQKCCLGSRLIMAQTAFRFHDRAYSLPNVSHLRVCSLLRVFIRKNNYNFPSFRDFLLKFPTFPLNSNFLITLQENSVNSLTSNPLENIFYLLY